MTSVECSHRWVLRRLDPYFRRFSCACGAWAFQRYQGKKWSPYCLYRQTAWKKLQASSEKRSPTVQWHPNLFYELSPDEIMEDQLVAMRSPRTWIGACR